MHSPSSIELAMKRVEIQSVLFAAKPSRLALQSIDCDFTGCRCGAVNVWRNHAIEPVLDLARPFLFWGGWNVQARVSDYDDTLMYADHSPADAELLWLDSSRYRKDDDCGGQWIDWLASRVRALRAISTAPILIASWLQGDAEVGKMQALTERLPAVYFADMAAVCAAAGARLLDARTAIMAGTPVANTAQTLIARELVCRWLPAAMLPPIKAVALDLDQTLYAGVLGEDGVQGVELTDAHRQLHSYVKALSERGIFIALVSRNERPDVEELFQRRADFPLKWSDFSAVEISWGAKVEAIARVAEAVRIAPDAVLYVDDNPGELASIAAHLNGVHVVHAAMDAALTERAISFYPGLWRWKLEADDARRVGDLKANVEREALSAQATDPEEYFRSLHVSLTIRQNPRDELGRLADLCRKTNQFNIALRRLNQAELAELMERPDASVASVRLTDRLSDSGVVAVIVARRYEGKVIVEELCMSCRAMGRQLEDTVVLSAIAAMPIVAQCEQVAFRVKSGPRNQPARVWLASLTGSADVDEGLYTLPADAVRGFVPAPGVQLQYATQ